METRSKARLRRNLQTSDVDSVIDKSSKGSVDANTVQSLIGESDKLVKLPSSAKYTHNKKSANVSVDTASQISPRRKPNIDHEEVTSTAAMTRKKAKGRTRSPGRPPTYIEEQKNSPSQTVQRDVSTSEPTQLQNNSVKTKREYGGKRTNRLSTVVTTPMALAKWYVTVLNPLERALLYFLLVILGSIIHEFNVLPDTYFSDRKNFFNQVFVKLSWGWTMGILFLFLLPASYMLRKGNARLVIWDCSRLVVGGTALWYVVIGTFFWIEDVTGQCIGPGGQNYTVKRSCNKAGLQWDGYDISGHTFLLIHCALLIYEELGRYLKSTRKQKGKQKKSLLQYFIDVMFVVVVMMVVLWEFMLICTQVYFHIWHHKIIAVVVAFITWSLTYRGLYPKLDSVLSNSTYKKKY